MKVAFLLAVVASTQVPSGVVEKLAGDLVGELKAGSGRNYDVLPNNTTGDDAAAGLVAIGKPAVPRLILALKDKNGWTRVFAAESLAKIGATEAAEPLAQAAAVEREAGVMGVLLEALGKLGGSKYFDLLKENASSTVRQIRQGAVTGLGETKDPRAVPILMTHLKDMTLTMQTGSQVYDRLAEDALVKIGPASFDALKGALGNPDKDLREFALSALSSLDDPRVTPFLLERSKNSSTRTGALTLLFGRKDAGKEVDAMAEASLTDPDWRLRAAAVDRLALNAKPSLIPALAKALLDICRLAPSGAAGDAHGWVAQNGVVSGICQIFVSLNDPSAIPTLKTAILAMREKEVTARLAIEPLKALNDLNDTSAGAIYDALVRLPKEEGSLSWSSLQSQAADGCGRVGFASMEPLSKLFKAGKLDGEIYAEALGVTSDPKCLPLVLEATKSSNEDVRRSARYALGNFADRKAETEMVSFLDDSPGAPFLAERLVEKGNEAGLSYLMKHDVLARFFGRPFREGLLRFPVASLKRAIGGSSPSLRLFAGQALWVKKEPEGGATLRDLVLTGPADIARRAADILAPDKSPETSAALLKALDRPEVFVRLSAYLALQPAK